MKEKCIIIIMYYSLLLVLPFIRWTNRREFSFPTIQQFYALFVPLPLLVSMRDFRMHFCLLALSRAVCLWSHEFVVEHEFVLHSVVCDADKFNNNIHDSSTECTLFSWTFISKIVEGGIRNSEKFLLEQQDCIFISVSTILEIFLSRSFRFIRAKNIL